MPSAPNRLTFDAGTLLLEISGGPIGNHAKALDEVFGRGLWVWDPRVSRWRTDAYRYDLIRKIVDERSLPIDDQVGTVGNSVTEPSSVNQPGSTNPPGSNTTTAAGLADVLREPSANKLPTLRPEQAQAIAGWEKSRQGIIVMRDRCRNPWGFPSRHPVGDRYHLCECLHPCCGIGELF